MRVTNMSALLKAAALVLAGGLVACSTSEFGGKAIKSSAGDAKKADTDESSGDAGDAGDTAVSDNGNGGETINSDGAKELSDRSDSARRNDIDETVAGCKLPDDIGAKVKTGGSSEGLDLLGWGGSDNASPAGVPELTNLDLNDCAWFKGNPNVKQVYVFQQKSLGLMEGVVQSYVEPVPEGATAFCGRSAMSIAASVRDRGTFSCAMMPQAGQTN